MLLLLDQEAIGLALSWPYCMSLREWPGKQTAQTTHALLIGYREGRSLGEGEALGEGPVRKGQRAVPLALPWPGAQRFVPLAHPQPFRMLRGRGLCDCHRWAIHFS